MTKGTIVITGATGFLGSSILVAALRGGYKANIVVRSIAKEEDLKTSEAIRSLDVENQCKYFHVPDLTQPGSLDEAAAGADFFIHAAAPPPSVPSTPETEHELIVAPAIAITLNALEAARNAGTVRRVICVGSMIAFARPETLLGDSIPPNEDIVISEASLNDYLKVPAGGGLLTYGAAKTAAMLKSMEWMREANASAEGVNFDFITISPTYVWGRHPLAKTIGDLFSSSNALILRSAVGKTSSDVMQISGGAHIDDVVEAHLKALDGQTIETPTDGPDKGFNNFTFGVNYNFDNINADVDRLFPEEVRQGLLPNQGHFIARPRVSIDSSKFETAFGMVPKGTDDMIRSVITQFLELQAAQVENAA